MLMPTAQQNLLLFTNLLSIAVKPIVLLDRAGLKMQFFIKPKIVASICKSSFSPYCSIVFPDEH
jgi:hypothetical protein